MSLNSINSMNLKFGDLFSDCHYVKKITFSLDCCLLSMFSIFWSIIKYIMSFVISCYNFSLFMMSTLHFIL